MPMSLPSNSPDRNSYILIAAISGRSLASSARRSGFIPLVVDLFADQDTQNLSHACRKLDSPLDQGIVLDDLLLALQELSTEIQTGPAGLVYGSGFESRPGILNELSRYWQLLGNDAGTIAQANCPKTFVKKVTGLGLRSPEIQWKPPKQTGRWLLKLQGGAGGGHIRFATSGIEQKPGMYFQEYIPGRAVSALILGDGEKCLIVGYSDQWVEPAMDTPMRYGGAVRPAYLTGDEQEEIREAAQKLTRAFSLKGLCSIDFMFHEGEFFVLDINPRPGATLDLFDNTQNQLFKRHINAVLGTLPKLLESDENSNGSMIVYADKDLTVPPTIAWPYWVSDQPANNLRIKKNEPVCTISAVSKSPEDVKRMLRRQVREIRHLLRMH